MKLPQKRNFSVGALTPAPFFRMRVALVFAGMLAASGCVGVLSAAGQSSNNGDYYGDGYEDSWDGHADAQGGYDDPRGGYDDPQGGYDDSRGGYSGHERSQNPYDDYFYSRLRTHGDWMDVAGFGQVWRPRVVASWSPYTLGYWASTARGWMWVSYEPYGDVVYHYGNWANLEGYGWSWFPGRDWAPNHVDFTDWQDSIGWYPTAPNVAIQNRFDSRPQFERYIWTSHRNFLSNDLSRHREMNPTRLWRGAGPPGDDNHRGQVPTVEVVQRWTGKRPPVIQTQEVRRTTRRGDVQVIVPDQKTREHVRKKGAKISRPWMAPEPQAKNKQQGNGKHKGQDKGKSKGDDTGKVDG